MATTTIQERQDWQTEEQIAEQEFAEGVAVERDRRAPDRGVPDDANEYNANEGNANATTLYVDTTAEGYDPSQRLPTCEKWSTKGAKFRRLWALNSGVDSHRASRRSRDDCHKTNERTKDRQRFVHAVANRLGLSDGAVERARELAAIPTPNRLNFIGGLNTWILAVVLYAVNEQRAVMAVDRDALAEIRDDWGVSVDHIAQAVDMVGERA